MSLLAALASDNSIENEKDSVGGGYSVRDSGLYPMTVALAYLSTASSGALALNVTLKDGDGEVRQQFWMTSGKAKGSKNYYEKDGQKHYLPGFVQANALCLLTLGKEISHLDTEEKVINLYSSEAKAEVPTKVQMITDLLGQEVLVGLLKQSVDKTAKDAKGEYHPTGESRDENEVDKFFRARDKKTTAEIRAQAEDANFFSLWEQKWAGKVKDKTSKKSGKAGAPAQQSAATQSRPANSLFG